MPSHEEVQDLTAHLHEEIETLNQLADRLHHGVEVLRRLAEVRVDCHTPAARDVVASALRRLLDVRAGIDLIHGMERAEAPVPEEAVDAWVDFLDARLHAWAPLVPPRDFDELVEVVQSEGPEALLRLDWRDARVLSANRAGVCLPDTGSAWRDDPPNWKRLKEEDLVRAFDLYSSALHQALEALNVAPGMANWAVLYAVRPMTRELVPLVIPDPLERWRWLAEQVRVTNSTDALFGQRDAAESLEYAFCEIPVPESPTERAELLVILAKQISPVFMADSYEGALYELRLSLEREFGLEDLGGLSESALRTELRRIVNDGRPRPARSRKHQPPSGRGQR